MTEIFKKYWIYILLTTLLVTLLTVLWGDSVSKSITLIILLLTWLIVGLATGKFIKVSLLFIFLVLPFNLTVQLPESINILNTNIEVSNPYVGGLWANYLVPTPSVIDLFVFLFLVVIFRENRNLFFKVVKDKYLLIFLLFLAVQSIYVQEILALFQSVHLYTYIVTALLARELLNSKYNLRELLQSRYTNILILTTVLIQGSIGLLQFVRGISLGLHFLGESSIANGMMGSSFIQINGESYLRAYGTFPHPNVFAGWLILMFLILWISFTLSKQKIFPTISALLILLISILTFSRLSILILGLLSVVWILSVLKERGKVFSFSNILFVRFLNIFNGSDSSWSDRVELLRVNWKIFKENLLLGTGFGNSLKYYLNNIPYSANGKLLLQPVHNIFVLSLTELGLLGGIYFWFMNIKLFLKGVKWNTIKICILITVILLGLFDHYLLSLPQGNTIFYAFLILLTY